MTRLVRVAKGTILQTPEGKSLPVEDIRNEDSILSAFSLPVRILDVKLSSGRITDVGGLGLWEEQEIYIYKTPRTKMTLTEERKVDLCLFPLSKISVKEYNPEIHSLYRRAVFWKFRETESEPFLMARECAVKGTPLPEILLKNSRKTMEQALSGVLAASPTCFSHPPLTEKLRFSLGFGAWEGTKKTLDDICIGKICSLRGPYFPKNLGTKEVFELLLEDDVPIFLEDFTVI
nr:hypothetical protein MarFTME_464 [Marseillevirus futianmevirus]